MMLTQSLVDFERELFMSVPKKFEAARPLPPKAKASPPSASPKRQKSSGVGLLSGVVSNQGERIGVYGSGGIGKTELVASMEKVGIKTLFIDLDEGTLGLEVNRVADSEGNLISTFEAVREVLQNKELISQFDAVVIDTFTKLEELIGKYVIETVPHEKLGKKINSLEDYGFGKGLVHVFEKSLLVLSDLDNIARSGKHVVLICHQTAEKVPSAESDDYLEYQPRLQSPSKTAKLRERVFEWCNHFFRVDHDRFVQDGKVEKSDSRAIHTVRSTTAWAKHRTLGSGREIPDVIEYKKGSFDIWKVMFGE